jgi:hypothetical protein
MPSGVCLSIEAFDDPKSYWKLSEMLLAFLAGNGVVVRLMVMACNVRHFANFVRAFSRKGAGVDNLARYVGSSIDAARRYLAECRYDSRAFCIFF